MKIITQVKGNAYVISKVIHETCLNTCYATHDTNYFLGPEI